MINVAILGFGTVGSGVYEVLKNNAANITRRAGQPVEVKYILDIRDFSARPDAALFVNQIDPILKDDQVSTVVETIGGTKPAYFCQSCIGGWQKRLHFQQRTGGDPRGRAVGAGCAKRGLLFV